MDLKIKIDLKKVNQAFIKLGKEINNLDEPLKTAGGYMIREMTKNIKTATEYTGKAMKKNTAATWAIKSKLGKTAGVLQFNGNLLQSLDFINKQKLFVIIGSNLPYAAIQQNGAKKGSLGAYTAKVKTHQRKTKYGVKTIPEHSRKGVAPWGDIPSRKFAGFNDNNKKRIQLIFDDYSKKIIKQAGLE